MGLPEICRVILTVTMVVLLLCVTHFPFQVLYFVQTVQTAPSRIIQHHQNFINIQVHNKFSRRVPRSPCSSVQYYNETTASCKECNLCPSGYYASTVMPTFITESVSLYHGQFPRVIKRDGKTQIITWTNNKHPYNTTFIGKLAYLSRCDCSSRCNCS